MSSCLSQSASLSVCVLEWLLPWHGQRLSLPAQFSLSFYKHIGYLLCRAATTLRSFHKSKGDLKKSHTATHTWMIGPWARVTAPRQYSPCLVHDSFRWRLVRTAQAYKMVYTLSPKVEQIHAPKPTASRVCQHCDGAAIHSSFQRL